MSSTLSMFKEDLKLLGAASTTLTPNLIPIDPLYLLSSYKSTFAFPNQSETLTSFGISTVFKNCINSSTF